MRNSKRIKVTYNQELRLFSAGIPEGMLSDLGKHSELIMSRSNPELGTDVINHIKSINTNYVTVPIGKSSKNFHYNSVNDYNGKVAECFYDFDSNINVVHLLNKKYKAELVYDNQLYELKYLGNLNLGNYESQVFIIHNKKSNEEYLEVEEVILSNYIYKYLENNNSTVP